MVSITLSVSEETKKLMKKFQELNWSGFIRKSIEDKAKELEWKEKILNQLKEEEEFTKWSVELGRKAKKGRMQKISSRL